MYAYLKRDPNAPGGLRLEPLVDSGDDGDLWYGLPKQRFERSGVRDPVITKPYTYLGTDIIENVSPIIIGGKFQGITSLDITLTEVQKTLAEESRRLEADLFLTTRGLFIAATSDDRGDTKLRTTPVAESALAPVFKTAESHIGGSWTDEDPLLREDCFYVAGRVPTGEWTLVLRKPTSVLLGSVVDLAVRSFTTASVGIVVIAALLWFGARAFGRRVRGAQAMAERIADGDLSGDTVAVSGRDESAELVRSMNQMNENLASVVGAVRGACTRLAATSAQLAATSQEQRMTVGSFGASTAQMAAAVREIAATGSELLHSIEGIDGGARRTAASARGGRARLDAVSGTMSRLDAGAKDISDRLALIAEKAEAISTVVTAISKVAEQTNLLSVNAAIEAEKAGEAGFGFLVVAREIRRLADQTAGASLDISRIVAQMQASVTEGVAEMARFTGAMRSGTGDVQTIASELGRIIEEMDASFASFSEVRTGMSSQSQGVAQIESAVVQVAEGARQSTTAVAEFGRVADELAHAVAVLQDAVARFRMREEPPT
jgi:methyl-accepting chemotaxis protein WspA